MFTKDFKFHIFMLNSVKVTGVIVFLALFTSALAGYAFAKLRFKFKNILFLAFLSTMMVPELMLLMPRFSIINRLGLYDTHFALFLIGTITTTGTFMMRQAYLSIPDALIESAALDGAGNFYAWWKIILPNTKQTLVSLSCILCVWWWNDYLNPLVFLTDKKLFTIPVGLSFFVGEKAVSGAEMGPIMAETTIALLPIIIVYLCIQRYITEGLVSTGVKG